MRLRDKQSGDICTPQKELSTSLVASYLRFRPNCERGFSWCATCPTTSQPQESGKEQLVARVTSRGKVLMTNLTSYDLGGKLPEKPSSYEKA